MEKFEDTDGECSRLRAQLRTPFTSEWNKALNELCQLGARAVPTLLELTQSDDKNNRGPAAWTLGEMGKSAASGVPRLIECLPMKGCSVFRIRSRVSSPISRGVCTRKDRSRAARNHPGLARSHALPKGKTCDIHSRRSARDDSETRAAAQIAHSRSGAKINSPNLVERIANPTDPAAALDPNYEITDAMLLKILGNVGK